MKTIEKGLDKLVPNPVCELRFGNNFELLVAVILSAQCTDKRVNVVTEKMFKKWKTPQDFAKLSQTKLEKEIFTVGFYHNKAKNIISASKEIISNFGGEIPNSMEKLTSLAGVGRKTASVVLSVGFNKPAFAVDTHVFRVANRLGIGGETPLKCEESLKKHFKKENWSKLHLQMVNFGRYFCKAKNPKCEICPLCKICKYKEKKCS